MAFASIRIEGLGDAVARLDPAAITRAATAGVRSAMAELAPAFERRIKARAPVRRGRLKANVRVEAVDQPGGAGLGIALVFYGWPVESRTPFVAPAIRDLIEDGTLRRAVTRHVTQAIKEALQ